MFLDKELTFSDQQDVSASDYSTNSVELPAMAAGTTLDMSLSIVVRSESGTSPTLTVELETSSDNVTFSRVTSAKKPTNRKIFGIHLNGVLFKRYARLRYVLGGTTPVYNITAAFVAGEQFDVLDMVHADSARIS